MTLAGSAVASSRRRTGGGPTGIARACSRAFSTSASLGSNLRRLLQDHARRVGVLVVDLAAHEHDRVERERLLVGGERSAEDEQLDAALEVVERGEHHRVASLRADLLALRDDPADGDPLAVAAVGELRERAVDSQRASPRAPPSAGARRRTGRSTPSRPPAAPPARTPPPGSAGGSARRTRPRRRCAAAAGRRRIRRGRRSSPGRSARPAARFWPADCACSSTASMPLRVAPVEPNAPHLISASIAFLLTVRLSTRSQKSQIEANGPPSSRARLDRLDGREADALHGVEAEADLAVDDHELVVGLVDVRRQDLDPHLLGLRDEERDLVLRVHHRGDQRGHVLGRVVGLQPGGAVGDQRVAGGVRLVERVVGRLLVRLPQRLDHRLRRRPRPGSPRRTPASAAPSPRGSSCRSPCAGRPPSRPLKPASDLAICIACSW